VQAGLQKMGYTLKPLSDPYGNLQAVIWRRGHGRGPDSLEAAADPRGVGSSEVVLTGAGSSQH